MIVDTPDAYRVNVIVNSKPQYLEDPFRPTACDEELAAQMSMMGVRADTALSDNTPETRITRDWIEQLPSEWKNSPLILMVRVHWAIPGHFPSMPGAHFDVMGGEDPMNSFRPQPAKRGWEQLITVLGPEGTGTHFVEGKVPFNYKLKKQGRRNRGRRRQGSERLRFLRPWDKKMQGWLQENPDRVKEMEIGEQGVMDAFSLHFGPRIPLTIEKPRPRILLRARRHASDPNRTLRTLNESTPLIAPISNRYYLSRGTSSVWKDWTF